MQENNINNQEQSHNEGGENQKTKEPWLSFFEHEHFTHIVELVKEYIAQRRGGDELSLKAVKNERFYMFATTFLTLGAIVTLSYIGVLDKTSSGTLVGAVIGYALAKRADEN